MITFLQLRLLTVVIFAIILTAGCSLSKFQSDKVDYKSAGELPPLEVPPDLTRPATDERFSIPGAASPGALPSPYANMLKGSDGTYVLTVNDPFDRAWRKIGLALDSSGISVEDRDRSKGLYHIRYTKTKMDTDDSKPGFFSRLLGGDKKKTDGQQFQILVKETAAASQVSVLDHEGKSETSEVAAQILSKLYDQLK